MNDEPTEIDEDGDKFWKNSEGKLHRDHDLPAVIGNDGYCAWYKEDTIHRDNNLPAIIWPNSWCEWWVEDKLVREKRCTKKEIEQYKKPFYFNVKFNRFENLIKKGG